MWRCFTSKKPCLACGMERHLWTARTLVSSHWPPHMHQPPRTRMRQHLLQVRQWSRLACDMCIKNTVHKFLECSAIGCNSCSTRSGAVGASMRSSAVTVAKGGMYQSDHGIYHALYHDTKVVYTSIYTM